MARDLKELLGSYEPLLDAVLAKLSDLKSEQKIKCDHICYRVETSAEYERLKKELLDFGEIAAETLVSGRKISIIKLFQSIQYQDLQIECIELPAPKPGSNYAQGWEHAEIVLTDLQSFIAANPNIDFNHKAMKREINPELGWKIDSNYQIKFHPLHILDVIEIEKEQQITSVP